AALALERVDDRRLQREQVAADGGDVHHGVSRRSARWPMSVRHCAPANEIFSTAWYACCCACRVDSPSAVTQRTRPPEVTGEPSRSVVPAWKTLTPSSCPPPPSPSPETMSPDLGVAG